MNSFSKSMKLADLLDANHYLILALPRLGIPLGFGEKSVEEVCKTYNVPVDFFLLVCNAYTFNSFMPDEAALYSIDMSLLVPYLRASHSYYLNSRIPHIDSHLRHVADRIEGRMGEMLKKFFDDYRNEVAEHFRYEEKEVFLALDSKSTLSDGICSHINTSHEEIEDKLNDLTQIVYKYLPPEMASDEVIELVFDVLQLAEDLKKHEVIEEKVLLPYIKTLEDRR